jgi:hypothetical protein
MNYKILDGTDLWERTESGVLHRGTFQLDEGTRSPVMQIIEKFSGSWVDFKEVKKNHLDERTLNLMESQVEGVLLVLEGRFQMADTKNANNRIYPNPIWEAVLDNTSKAMRRLKSGEMLGELDHPRDGETRLDRVAAVMTDLRRNPQNEKEILGRMAILGTPAGQKAYAIHAGGGRFGVSSRGAGSVVRMEGTDVVQNDYNLETWDIVHNPSTPGAYPEVITVRESVNESKKAKKPAAIRESAMSTLGRVEKLLERCKARDLQSLSVDTLQYLKEDLDIAKKDLSEARDITDTAKAAGVIAESVLMVDKIEKQIAEGTREGLTEATAMSYSAPTGKKLSSTPAKGGGNFEVYARDTSNMRGSQDKFAMYIHGSGRKEYYGSHPSQAGALKFAKNHGLLADAKNESVARPQTKEGAVKILEGIKTDTTNLKELTKQFQSQYRSMVEAEGPLRTYELDAISVQVQERMNAPEDIQDLSETDKTYYEAARRFKPLLESQTDRAAKAEAMVSQKEAQVSEMSAQVAAAKQVMEALVERTKIAEETVSHRDYILAEAEEKLEAAYQIIDRLVEEIGVERVRGAVEGIASTHPTLPGLAETICNATTLSEAVQMTNRLVLDSLPPVREEFVESFERNQLIDDALRTTQTAQANLLKEQVSPSQGSANSMVETANRALHYMAARGIGK